MSSMLSKSSMSRKKPIVRNFFTKSIQTDERKAVDLVRMEIVSMLRLATHGQGSFAGELAILTDRLSAKQREAVRYDLRRIAAMIDTKISSEDDA